MSITLAGIQHVACRLTGVLPPDLKSPSRTSRLVLTRELIVFIARRVTTISYPDIARATFHSPSHSTAIESHARAAKKFTMKEDAIEYNGEVLTFDFCVRWLEATLEATDAHRYAVEVQRAKDAAKYRARMEAA